MWYSASIAGSLEVFQKKFCKRNLGIRMNTPDHAVFGGLGILPVSLRLKKNVLKYLHRLNAMPDSSPVKWAYRELISLHDMGFKTWYGRACELMQEFESISGDESFLDLQGSHVKRRLDSVYRTTFSSTWLSEINDGVTCRKLRTYKLFKSVFKFEKYLHIPFRNVRVAISRFRMSSHHLPIELGRHHKPITPEENRICVNCNVLGDEMHHLLDCSIAEPLREILFESASKYIFNFRRLRVVFTDQRVIIEKA